MGYARGFFSSRKIEQACRENVVFLALACGQQHDHSTVAAFVSSMKDEILPLFRNVLWVWQEMDLLGGTFFALDGVKLPSNASKKGSGTYSELNRSKERSFTRRPRRRWRYQHTIDSKNLFRQLRYLSSVSI